MRLTLAAALTSVLIGVGMAAPPSGEYGPRVEVVRQIPGMVVFWDFVKRDGGRFAAWQAKGDAHDFRLDAANYVRDYWNTGRAATYEDFPLLGRGPFGQAVRVRNESDPDFRPLLLVPRERLHNSGLDVKGAGRSVSMVVWLIRESGNHALAGIWHEGTDLKGAANPVRRVEPGKRQYALFAGLAGNNGASAAHVSENGASSFGDRYARNLAVTPEVMPAVPADSGATCSTAPGTWPASSSTTGGIRSPPISMARPRTFGSTIRRSIRSSSGPTTAGRRPNCAGSPDSSPARTRTFPRRSSTSRPRAGRSLALCSRIVETNAWSCRSFRFTKVRVTLRRGRKSAVKRELVALRVNPFWFGHDLYAPRLPEDGGPFTIGRVIHSSRGVGLTGYIGGVAVFGRALSAQEMKRLSEVARAPISN